MVSSSPPSVSSRTSATTSVADMASKKASKRPKQLTPQEAIDEFWAKFSTKTPGKATTVIPQSSYTGAVAEKNKPSVVVNTQASYDDAAAMCRAKVQKIVKECRRINKKYRDPHFDIESDLKLGVRDCLQSLSNAPDGKPPGSNFSPQSVKRVVDIFDKPKFFIAGPSAKDVRQGRDGDCWLMSSLCLISNKKGLIEKLCVAYDEDVGCYGFVFHRDGEWISEIVDDFLYLTKPDYDEGYLDRVLFDDVERINPEEAYRKIYQSNSGSLYFAQCEHPQETWLPILEKSFAKAHGDYAAIEGGFGGEGIEDLTGGVTSELYTTDILDKEHFWKEELLKVNEEFLFGCSTGVWGNGWGERRGIVERHAYSIQKAVEVEGQRLLRLRNPWGKSEWKGPWSDGSKEWNTEWMTKLDHRFGDDGDFWIAYDDLLKKYQSFDRTRLFGPDWRVTQTWTTLSVPWTLDYLDTHFSFTISRPGPIVIVLAQLDDRYFRGLEGQYSFELAFRIHKAGHEDYIVRSQRPYRMRRSVNVELDLEAGEYDVRVKIDATRHQKLLPIEKVVRNNAKERRDKLIRIGLAYDLAHGKGRIVETDEERISREAHEKKTTDDQKKEIRQRILESREQAYYLRKKQYERDQRKQLRQKEKRKAKIAEKKERKAKDKAEAESAQASQLQNGERAEDKQDVEGAAPTTPRSLQTDETSPATPKETTFDAKSGKRVAGKSDNGDSDASETTLSSGVTPTEDTDKIKTVSFGEPPHQENPVELSCESGSDDDLNSIDTMSEISDRELQIQVDQLHAATQPTPKSVAVDTSDEEPDEFERDPWNAVVVVGLRIYHKVPSEDQGDEVIQLKVVRSDPYTEDKNGTKKTEAKDEKSRGLDVDDSAKDATLKGSIKERKKSIMGDSSKLRRDVESLG